MARPSAFTSLILNGYGLTLNSGIVSVNNTSILNVLTKELINGSSTWGITAPNPTQNQHIVHKGYVDSQFIELTNALPYLSDGAGHLITTDEGRAIYIENP